MSIALEEKSVVTDLQTEAPTFEEAVAFIWAEADMLDRLDYKPWLKLWTETGKYIIPVDRDADYADALNIVYDDQEMRQARVKRLLSGFSMSSAPPARTVRTVSRFVVEARDETSITLRGAQMLAEYKYEHMRFLPADMRYRIVRAGNGSLRIDEKVVTLINADDFQFGIGYLL
ncbi:aromatic-ring-hydroxylating dioxygenase subunit beta [Sphingobium sp. Sx8-8]|uniref:aromatic-ring-hydroxylating dioxygenase subunit beta n=1 Tax=Sphingobium sp. Sx8-8 TaxID=2933617 RepID=UPI001F5688C2|nr:aromatic-ring-hydroxylating dioxygenase subunit beta [Sphingobium sp. Sx8-8]